MVTVVTDRSSFLDTAEAAPAGTRVPIEVRIESTDPFESYQRARDGPGGAYLETGGGQSGWGYFATDPCDRLTVRPAAVTDEGGSATLAALAGLLDGEHLVRGGCDVPYPCCVVGWLSYDVTRELEAIPDDADDERGLPRLQVAVYDVVAAWETSCEDGATLRVTACPRVSGDPGGVYDRGLAAARNLANRAVDGDPSIEDPPVRSDSSSFESTAGAAAYAEKVRRVRKYIRAGDTFQANISHRLEAPAVVHPARAFEALRGVNPAPYSALLEFPDVDIVSASPELLLEVDGDRILTEPIAGTRPRGSNADEDDELEHDLRTDEKERAEHAMLVDLERNDLGKVCEFGTVTVDEYRRVDRYAEVMHLVSLVEGKRRENASLTDAIAALFPGGTITGAPKPRTMQIIDELEGERRGPYTGSVGIFGFDERATLNIVIRTLVRHSEEYHLRVGAGIVHDSVPEREYRETLDKARALVNAVDDALASRISIEVGE